MKHTILAFAFFIGWISIYFSQDEATKIGFGCSKSESPSQLVNKIGDLILANKLEEVSAMLTSENASENYIAVVCIEKLVKAGHYTPSKDDSLNISKIHLSNRLIPTCSGCTKADEVTMDKLIKKNYACGAIYTKKNPPAALYIPNKSACGAIYTPKNTSAVLY